MKPVTPATMLILIFCSLWPRSSRGEITSVTGLVELTDTALSIPGRPVDVYLGVLNNTRRGLLTKDTSDRNGVYNLVANVDNSINFLWVLPAGECIGRPALINLEPPLGAIRKAKAISPLKVTADRSAGVASHEDLQYKLLAIIETESLLTNFGVRPKAEATNIIESVIRQWYKNTKHIPPPGSAWTPRSLVIYTDFSNMVRRFQEKYNDAIGAPVVTGEELIKLLAFEKPPARLTQVGPLIPLVSVVNPEIEFDVNRALVLKDGQVFLIYNKIMVRVDLDAVLLKEYDLEFKLKKLVPREFEDSGGKDLLATLNRLLNESIKN
jgi:hypothetical protein